MARAKKALDALPTDGQASEAVEALKARVLAEMAKIPHLVPGSDEWLAVLERRPDFALVAASCHRAAELDRAAALGCDFAVFGPVRPTASHPGAAGIGWEAFAAALAVPPLPTLALGGLNRADLDAAQRAGAHGIAAIRSAWD